MSLTKLGRIVTNQLKAYEEPTDMSCFTEIEGSYYLTDEVDDLRDTFEEENTYQDIINDEKRAFNARWR